VSNHPSDTELLEFRNGKAEPDSILAIDDHLAACEDCRARLTAILPAGGNLQSWAEGAIRDEREESPSVAAMPKRRNFAPIVLAIAAALVVAAVIFWKPAPKPEIAKAPENLTLIKDAAGTVELEANGTLKTTASLSPAQQTLVGDVLRNGKFAQALLPAELNTQPGTLLGPSDKTLFTPVAPLGIVAEDRPQFEWKPLEGATTYHVAVFDKDFRQVVKSDAITGTTWFATKPLPRGTTFIWQVSAKGKSGATVTAPAPPAAEARFQIVAEADSDAIIAARVQQPPSHLLLAALYAKLGMKSDALRELAVLEALNPDSQILKKLHASLQ